MEQTEDKNNNDILYKHDDLPPQIGLSLVIPTYNEEGSVILLIEKLSLLNKERNYDLEYIFIDDGSTDNTFNLLKRFKKIIPQFYIIKFRNNKGKSEALNAGFRKSSKDFVVTLDADLQDDPSEIPLLIDKLKNGHDVVSGWKANRQDPLEKKIPSRLFNYIVRKTSGVKIHDFNCGLKAYRSEVIKKLELYGEHHRFIPVIAHNMGFKVGENKVNHFPRKYGESKFGIERYFKGLFDFVTIILITKYSSSPLHFFGGFGLLISFIGFSILSYLFIAWAFFNQAINSRPLFFFGILLTVLGIQVLTTGLLAELIVNKTRKNEKLN